MPWALRLEIHYDYASRVTCRATLFGDTFDTASQTTREAVVIAFPTQKGPVVDTFAEYVPKVALAAGPGARRTYSTYWAQIIAAFGDRRLDQCGATDIETASTWWRQTITWATAPLPRQNTDHQPPLRQPVAQSRRPPDMAAVQRGGHPLAPHTTLTWVERRFGHAIARAYAGHNDHPDDSTSICTRAQLPEIATALATLTGEPHPLTLEQPDTHPSAYRTR